MNNFSQIFQFLWRLISFIWWFDHKNKPMVFNNSTSLHMINGPKMRCHCFRYMWMWECYALGIFFFSKINVGLLVYWKMHVAPLTCRSLWLWMISWLEQKGDIFWSRVHVKEDDVALQVDLSMNLALQVWITEVSNLVATGIYLIKLFCYNVLVEPKEWNWAEFLCKILLQMKGFCIT